MFQTYFELSKEHLTLPKKNRRKKISQDIRIYRPEAYYPSKHETEETAFHPINSEIEVYSGSQPSDGTSEPSSREGSKREGMKLNSSVDMALLSRNHD